MLANVIQSGVILGAKYVLRGRLKARARKREMIVTEDRPVLGVER